MEHVLVFGSLPSIQSPRSFTILLALLLVSSIDSELKFHMALGSSFALEGKQWIKLQPTNDL